MLSDIDIERIQFECLAILSKQTERYNSGDSSSIRVETAQNILTSIMFTIGVWLKTFHIPDDAALAIKNSTMDDLYQKGRKRIDKMVKSVKILHSTILRKLVDSQNVFYHSTVVDGIKGFFKLYYPEFGAQEIHITADYPVYNPMKKLVGIEFIQEYLKNIYFENLFCSNFRADDIHHLLCGYDEHYQHLLFNIYEPVLAAAIGCVLADTDIQRLDITPSAVSHLNRLFARKSITEIEDTLIRAVTELKQYILLADNLERYIKVSLSLIAVEVKSAVVTQTLDKVFIVAKYPENDPKIYFSFGNKMDNEIYRKVVNEIMQSHTAKDKIDVIKEYVQSLADLEDILLDTELYPNEITEILKELSPAEIAALSKKYIQLEHIDFADLRESEKILYECLCGFIASLPKEQQVWIDKAVRALSEDTISC
ncbi:DUF6179 domain-containing protein [Anaerovirgula multivorans]